MAQCRPDRSPAAPGGWVAARPHLPGGSFVHSRRARLELLPLVVAQARLEWMTGTAPAASLRRGAHRRPPRDRPPAAAATRRSSASPGRPRRRAGSATRPARRSCTTATRSGSSGTRSTRPARARASAACSTRSPAPSAGSCDLARTERTGSRPHDHRDDDQPEEEPHPVKHVVPAGGCEPTRRARAGRRQRRYARGHDDPLLRRPRSSRVLLDRRGAHDADVARARDERRRLARRSGRLARGDRPCLVARNARSA